MSGATLTNIPFVPEPSTISSSSRPVRSAELAARFDGSCLAATLPNDLAPSKRENPDLSKRSDSDWTRVSFDNPGYSPGGLVDNRVGCEVGIEGIAGRIGIVFEPVGEGVARC